MRGKTKTKANVEVRYEITVRDKSGKVIKRVRGRAKSFVRWFLQYIHGMWGTPPQNYVSITFTDGTSDDVPCGYISSSDYLKYWTCKGEEAEDMKGIVVGTGTTAPSPGDTKLESQVPHGEGDNQLYHYAQDMGSMSVSGNEVSFTMSRNFENRGSVSIDIAEIGLYALFDYLKGGSEYFKTALMIRDVLPSVTTVPAGATLTVKYTIKTTT